MKELQAKYVPKVGGTIITIPCHADGVSVERMNECQRQRSMELTPEDQLVGLEPTPQEFHHRGNVMKVSPYVNINFLGNHNPERPKNVVQV